MTKMVQVYIGDGKFKLATLDNLNTEIISCRNQELDKGKLDKALVSAKNSYTKAYSDKSENDVIGVVEFSIGRISILKDGKYKGRIWAGGQFSGKHDLKID